MKNLVAVAALCLSSVAFASPVVVHANALPGKTVKTDGSSARLLNTHGFVGPGDVYFSTAKVISGSGFRALTGDKGFSVAPGHVVKFEIQNGGGLPGMRPSTDYVTINTKK